MFWTRQEGFYNEVNKHLCLSQCPYDALWLMGLGSKGLHGAPPANVPPTGISDDAGGTLRGPPTQKFNHLSIYRSLRQRWTKDWR
jgi:hypothetical protein